MPNGQEETNILERRWQELHRISLVIQWLRPCTFTIKGTGSIPGWGAKIPHVLVWPNTHTHTHTHTLAAKQMLNAIFKEKRKKSKNIFKTCSLFQPQVEPISQVSLAWL